MKKGGQNLHIGNNPVHMGRPQDILLKLCEGGWSAVIDASKCFYNFPTQLSDRPFLGCIHPRTQEHLWCTGLPMGSSSLPGTACRFGNSLVRSLLEDVAEFQGVPHEKTWGRRLWGMPHNPDWGHGRVLIGEDGLPLALLWGHVDDFFIHAPAKEKLERALNAFLNKALAFGLICQPCKTAGAGQVHKFCGLMCDTRAVPCIRIPEDKRDRALASIACLRSGADQRTGFHV